jgi:AraC family transcriptional regulator
VSSHHGALLGTLEAGGFRLFRVLYRSGTSVGRHNHDRPQIGLVHSGELLEEAAGRAEATAAGFSVLRPAGCEHSNRVDSADALLTIVEVPAERWSRLDPLIPNREPLWACELSAPQLHRRILASARGEDLGNFALEASLLELLAALGSQLTKRGDELRVARVAERFEQDPSLSIEELALEEGLTKGQLLDAFRRERGISLRSYQLDRRLERARELVAGTSLSLAAVAVEAGFCDQAHFTRCFRKAEGMTPGEFRRRRR